jgi:succinylglutamate desuccinylase
MSREILQLYFWHNENDITVSVSNVKKDIERGRIKNGRVSTLEYDKNNFDVQTVNDTLDFWIYTPGPLLHHQLVMGGVAEEQKNGCQEIKYLTTRPQATTTRDSTCI